VFFPFWERGPGGFFKPQKPHSTQGSLLTSAAPVLI
jgi:hypothetical protein